MPNASQQPLPYARATRSIVPMKVGGVSKFYLITLFSLALLWSIEAPRAQSKNTPAIPVANGEIVRGAARITFEWPQETGIHATVKGNSLIITFNRSANPNFIPVLKSLYPYITGGERKADGKTILFTLDKPYKIRSFQSETINGVELLGVDLAARPERMNRMAALAPAAGEEPAAPVAAAAEATPAPTTSETAAPAPAAETAPAVAPVAPETAAVATEPAKTEPMPQAQTETAEIPLPPTGQPPAVTDRVVVGVSPATDNAVLRFPFAERTAMAVFVRSRTLWIAWAKPLPADLSDFAELPRTVIGKAEAVEAKGATVIRMPIDDRINVSVKKEQNSFDWAILLTSKKQGLEKPLLPQVNTDPPTPAHVFLPALETADPVTVTDPQVGDQLAITPFYSVGEGVSPTLQFVDFALLETAQGLAVVKKSDDVAIVLTRNGLRISTPAGATLTPGLVPIDKKVAAAASLETSTLFPYEVWKGDADPKKRKEQLRALFRSIVESENTQDSNAARLRIAQIYLSEGMAVEALGFLDGINRVNPAFFRSNKLAALRGAANFLMYRFVDASKDMTAAELNNNKEIDYWRAMLGDLLGNSDQQYDYLALNTDFISKYPPVFRQRLAIVAADRSIAGKEYDVALKIFDTLTTDNLIESIGPYVNFLMAKISIETGQEKDALETWDKLAEDYEHPFVRARAEFSRILWGIEHNTLQQQEAVDRLEKLRLSWHGDSLELSILGMLGDMYSNQKNYVEAMRVWHGGVMSFPNTATSVDMTRKMQEAFITMFNEGIADQLPPLEALSLYYEYRNYTPTGNTGNAIINRLADRLITVDLLDQAATLLDRQMRFQMEKDARSEAGAKLATVYLLNHQPNKALTALQDSVYGENPLMLRLLRNRLAAQAMVDLGQYDKALSTLGQDNNADAERIRISVYWKEKNWPQLITSIENMLKTRKDITAPVTVEEGEYLLRLALAYIFQDNHAQLQYLHDYFGPLMEKNPYQKVFAYITDGDISLSTTNFDQVMQNVADTRSFIESYRARIDAEGLSSITK